MIIQGYYNNQIQINKPKKEENVFVNKYKISYEHRSLAMSGFYYTCKL